MLGAGSALLLALLKHVEEPKQKLSILVHQNGKTVNATDKQHHAATPVLLPSATRFLSFLSVIMVDGRSQDFHRFPSFSYVTLRIFTQTSIVKKSYDSKKTFSLTVFGVYWLECMVNLRLRTRKIKDQRSSFSCWCHVHRPPWMRSNQQQQHIIVIQARSPPLPPNHMPTQE